MKPSLWILPSLLAAPALVPLVAAVAFDNGAARVSDRLSSQFLPEGVQPVSLNLTQGIL